MDMRKWLNDIMESDKRQAMPVLSFPATQLLGITVKELIADGAAQCAGMETVARRCPTAASVSMMDLSVEAECFGSSILVTDDEVPTVYGAVISSEEEVQALEVPRVGAGRTGMYVSALAQAKKRITDRPVFAGVIGPFSLAGRLMEVSEALVNCYDDTDMLHAALEKATEFLLRYIRAYKDAGADGVVMAEPAAGLLSPGLCSEFSSQYIKRITEQLQDDEFILIYHNCGPNVELLLPEILETGAAAYHFGNAVDMKKMLEKMPGDVLTMGNIDPVSVLRYGTPETVREETLGLLKKCSGYRNFLISSGCDIPPLTPWENIDAFFSAVEEFYGDN